MTRRIVIVGAGGHGREVLDAIRAVDAVAPTFEFVGFLAEGWADHDELTRLDAALLGGYEGLGELDAGYVVAIGDGAVRRQIDAIASEAGREALVVVHPGATVGSDVAIDEGCYIGPGARIMTNASLGRHVHVNANAVVSHDAVLGDFVTLSPGVLVNGRASVERDAFLGSGAVVLPRRVVGAGSVVGAGAVVTRDVPPGVTARGVPATWAAS